MCYPFWLVFSFIANRVGRSSLRVLGGRLQTPVVHYENPATHQRVVLVGTIHMGEPEYYRQLRRYIDVDMAQFRVLYEHIGKVPTEEGLRLSCKERRMVSRLDRLARSVRQLADLMSLQHQSDGLPPGDTWINTDMREDVLVREMVRRGATFERPPSMSRILYTKKSRHTARWVINFFLQHAVPIVLLAETLSHLFPRWNKTLDVVVDERNNLAMTWIQLQLKLGDVVAIWGTEHLRGLERGLRAAGFIEQQRGWFTAYHVRDYHLLKIVRRERARNVLRVEESKI